MVADWIWIPNIRCKISEGNAFLDTPEMDKKNCDGNCSNCNFFRGVDIRLIGHKTLEGCCTCRN